MSITITDILSLLRKIIDICIVWVIFYFILKNIRNNIKLSLIFKGVVFVIVLSLIGNWLNFTTVSVLLDYIIQWGPIAIIVIFQPEIRTILEQLGRSQLLGRHKILTVDEREHLVDVIVNVINNKKKEKIGALMVIERDISLSKYIEKAKKIYANVSSDLLISIFFKGNPFCDGGVVIQGDRISCAGAVFPTSNSPKLSRRLGTRHRAALGLSEQTDAICLVVSEETGRVSIALKGEMLYNLTLDDVRMMLIDELRPKQEVDIDDEIDEEEIYEEVK